ARPAPTAKQIAIAVAILAVLTSPASGYRGCHQPLATAGPNSSQGFLEPTRLIVILLHATGKSERRNPKACRAQTRLGHAGLDLLLNKAEDRQMTLTQRYVFKRIMTEWLRPPKAIRLLMGYPPKSTVRLWGDAHPKYVPPCPHKNGEFRLIRAFRVTRIASAD